MADTISPIVKMKICEGQNEVEVSVKQLVTGEVLTPTIVKSDFETGKVLKQLEFYFGDVNLVRDRFIASILKENDGWMPIKIILTFKRLQSLLAKVPVESRESTIIVVLKTSEIIEVDPSGTKIRRNPDIPFPTENRDERSVYLKGFHREETTLNELLEYFGKYQGMEAVIMRYYDEYIELKDGRAETGRKEGEAETKREEDISRNQSEVEAEDKNKDLKTETKELKNTITVGSDKPEDIKGGDIKYKGHNPQVKINDTKRVSDNNDTIITEGKVQNKVDEIEMKDDEGGNEKEDVKVGMEEKNDGKLNDEGKKGVKEGEEGNSSAKVGEGEKNVIRQREAQKEDVTEGEEGSKNMKTGEGQKNDVEIEVEENNSINGGETKTIEGEGRKINLREREGQKTDGEEEKNDAITGEEERNGIKARKGENNDVNTGEDNMEKEFVSGQIGFDRRRSSFNGKDAVGKVVRLKTGRKFKGSVYVVFKTKENAENLLNELTTYKGETMIKMFQSEYKLKKSREFEARQAARKGFIKCPKDLDKDDVKNLESDIHPENQDSPTSGGLIVRVKNIPQGFSREQLKEKWYAETHEKKFEIAFIEFRFGDESAVFRMIRPGSAKEALDILPDGIFKLGEDSFAKVEAFTEEEEFQYLKDIKVRRQVSQKRHYAGGGSRQRRGVGGKWARRY